MRAGRAARRGRPYLSQTGACPVSPACGLAPIRIENHQLMRWHQAGCPLIVEGHFGQPE